jgi:hypothetical protein
MTRDRSKSLTTRVAEAACPYCSHKLDAVSSVGAEVTPEPGDFTVCIECCNVLRFDANMQLCKSALTDIPMHSRLNFAKIVKHCGEMRAERKNQFYIQWIDKNREPECAPDPDFPEGIDLDMTKGERGCVALLPYPAKRCGYYAVQCRSCGMTAIVTTAGRADDPRSVKLACEGRVM